MRCPSPASVAQSVLWHGHQAGWWTVSPVERRVNSKIYIQADITNILARRRHDIVAGSLAADGLQLAEIYDF